MTPHQRKIAAIVPKLLKWFSGNARDLPWRRTTDPYCVFVSEIMLQQTQVQAVIPFWERWMRALPTIQSLARAKSEELHKLWEGLGYYRRVRNLQRAAQVIVKDHAGEVPADLPALLKLLGIGRYTAGAICSIAFNQPVPVLDGNVTRVLARLFAISGNVRKAAVRAELWSLAESLVRAAARAKSPTPCSHFNQALMELGALVCTPRQPRCPVCPLAQHCKAKQQDRVAELPNLGPRPRVTVRRFVAFVLERRGRFLVRQRPDGVVNGRLWEFPNTEVELGEKALPEAARSVFGRRVRILEPLGNIKHSITRYRITLGAFRVAPPRSGMPRRAGVWLSRRRLNQLAFASAHKKLLNRLLQPEPKPCPGSGWCHRFPLRRGPDRRGSRRGRSPG